MGESCGSEIGEHVQAANAHQFLVSADQVQVIRDGSSREKAVGWVAVIWQEIGHLVSNFPSKSDLGYTGAWVLRTNQFVKSSWMESTSRHFPAA